MPIQEVTKIRNQQMIFDRLELARSAGIISDFLLKWRGNAHELIPRLVVWSAASAPKDGAREQLARLLHGFIGPQQIMVLEE